MQLGEPLPSELTAMCEALPGRPTEIGIVRDAVRAYTAVRQHYENALKIQRGDSEGDNVVALPKGK
jgi:hypothetical protein